MKKADQRRHRQWGEPRPPHQPRYYTQMSRFFLNGEELGADDSIEFAGAAIMKQFRRDFEIPPSGELPYLFCGNGSCRDCNVLMEGLPDLPCCRFPLCPDLSLGTSGSSGESSGEENALNRIVDPRRIDESPRRTRIVVVGAGPAGLEAARAAREAGVKDVDVFEARSISIPNVQSPAPTIAIDGELFCFRNGAQVPLKWKALIVATGAFDRVHAFPGATLPGVLPMDLTERFAERSFLPGSRFLLCGGAGRARRLGGRLEQLGAERIIVASQDMKLASARGNIRVSGARLVAADPDKRSLSGGEIDVEVDTVVVEGGRVPSLGLARALGCETYYDPQLKGDRAKVSSPGSTTVPGVFLGGDVLGPAGEDEARRSGYLAGVAAARLVLSET